MGQKVFQIRNPIIEAKKVHAVITEKSLKGLIEKGMAILHSDNTVELIPEGMIAGSHGGPLKPRNPRAIDYCKTAAMIYPPLYSGGQVESKRRTH